MPSETERIPRITFSLGSFEEKVIVKMADKREVSKSEIVRTLIHNWIEENSDLLKTNYGIDLEDVSREILLESGKKDILEELVKSLKRVKSINIDRLAAMLDINPNDLVKIINDNGDKLEEKGYNLIVDEDTVKKL